jgi:two-component system sensor histidine kinase DesK
MGTMPLRRSKTAGAATVAPALAGLPPADDLDESAERNLRTRRLIIRLIVMAFLLLPAGALLATHGLTGQGLFLVPAAVGYTVLVDRVALVRFPGPVRRTGWSWLLLLVIVALAAGIFAVGHMTWMTPFAVAAAAVGRFAPTGRMALWGVAGCAATGLAIGVSQHLGFANTLTAAAVPALAGLLSHNAERRVVLIQRLRETRAELARMAVAEERLRISRDLHDLLGHSLSLIALKSELAGKTIDSDPARAAREIAEVETVARRSLAEMRQVVTSYRQPGLTAELAAARRMLASAGVDCRVTEPGGYVLPPEADALLAWTIREGTTNIVRHSGAHRAEITITVTGDRAAVELSDDGAGRAAGQADSAIATPAASTGLAGLAERARRIGGTLSAGTGQRGGFRLAVSVPLSGTPAVPGPAGVTEPAGAPVPGETAGPAPQRAGGAGPERVAS